MPRPTLEIFTSDSGSVIGVATLAGLRIGEVGPAWIARLPEAARVIEYEDEHAGDA